MRFWVQRGRFCCEPCRVFEKLQLSYRGVRTFNNLDILVINNRNRVLKPNAIQRRRNRFCVPLLRNRVPTQFHADEIGGYQSRKTEVLWNIRLQSQSLPRKHDLC